GPGIRNLDLELVRLPTQRQFLERCCRLGEEDQVERVVGPVGERDRRRHHTELPRSLERRTIDVRRRCFFHPIIDVADAQRMRGLTMLPPVSLPIEKATSPAAVAAPGPALEPDAPSSSSQGFIVWPPNQMSLSASAPRLSLARRTAPASSRRWTTVASCAGMRLRKSS